MRRRFVSILFCALLSSVAFAGDPMTSLKIEVKNLEGKPVERAAVIVEFKQGRTVKRLGGKKPYHWEIKTNQKGIATIPPIPQGKLLVQVIAKPYQTFADFFDVDVPEKTLEITMNPPQQQYSAH
jgi:hypothetical protein